VTEERCQCCFCGESVAPTDLEPVEIHVTFKDESSQVLWAHVDCCGDRLHPSVPWLSTEDREEVGE